MGSSGLRDLVEAVLDEGDAWGEQTLRPVDGIGAHLVPRITAEGLSIVIEQDLYFPPGRGTAKALARLQREGRAGPWSWTTGTATDLIADDIARAMNALGWDEDNEFDFGPPAPAPSLVDFPHTVTLWDWKEDPPYDEFNMAFDALVGILACERVVMTPWDSGGDTHCLTIADREVDDATADAIWATYLAEIPNQGATLVIMRPVEGRLERLEVA